MSVVNSPPIKLICADFLLKIYPIRGEYAKKCRSDFIYCSGNNFHLIYFLVWDFIKPQVDHR
jgi:hypothetical protein